MTFHYPPPPMVRFCVHRRSRKSTWLVALVFILLAHWPLRSLAQGVDNCDVYDGDWIYVNSAPRYRLVKPIVGADVLAQVPARHAKQPYRYFWGCDDKPKQIFEPSQYRWQPRNCELPELTRQSFCDKFAGLSVLFVGDSLQGQIFRSIVSLTNATLFNLAPIDGESRELGISGYNLLHEVRLDAIVNCNDSVVSHKSNTEMESLLAQTRLLFRRDEWFMRDAKRPKPTATEGTGGPRWYQPWGADLAQADVLVFNAGSHYRPSKQYKAEMQDTLDYLAKSWKPGGRRIIFRETAHHLPCKTLPRALRFSELSYFAANLTGGIHPTIGEVLEQNKFMADAVAAINGTTLFVNDLSRCRLDDHNPPHRAGDCSHFCLPGTPDTWNDILLHSFVP